MSTATELNRKKATPKTAAAARRLAMAQKGADDAAIKRLADRQATVAEVNGLADPDEGRPKPSAKSQQPAAPVRVPREKLHPHPQNRRVDIPGCAGLAESLAQDGQLMPLLVRPAAAVEHSDLPVGHFEILCGERRWHAAAIAGLDELLVVSREATDAEALVILHTENGQRLDLSAVEKGQAIADLCRPAAEGGAGLTRKQAGAIYSVSEGQASNLVRLLELPEIWRQRVAAGELPQTFARELLPYAGHAKAVAAIEKGTIAPAVKEDGAVTCSRNDFLCDCRSDIDHVTRLIAGYTAWGETLPAFELTDEVRAKLDCFELPALGHRQAATRCFNVKLWDKLQKPAVAKAKAGESKPQRQAKGQQPTANSPKLTPKQLAAKRQEAAERTAKGIARWRLQLLRAGVAELLDASRYAGALHRWTLHLASCPSFPTHGKTREALWETLKGLGVKASPGDYFDNARFFDAVGQVAPADRFRILEESARLMLRESTLEIPEFVVLGLALECELDVAALWRDAQKPGHALAPLLAPFFELHTTEQLAGLATELGVSLELAKTKGQQVKAFTVAPQRGRTLPLPKSVALLKPKRKPPAKKK